MIRNLLPLVALAGCTPMVATETPQAGPEAAAPGDGSCKIDGLTDLVGQAASSDLAADAMRRSGARTMRWIGPDTAVTMDFRPDRLNIDTDAGGKVTRFHCG
ncbi:I78 family peptidase inhibitor [Sphingomonas desiccabilis]|uniref:Peptidase inhibitor I78 n=1 Tax=Sphingomonas desiccabilis TaxID=429134 RepID=A0A4Q2J1Q1_9SPHN|nr:I78 family peptidase inhibitor [Sphingomonas desiccabilis]MBB3910657.1 hypothetical protein [Sphingomonas desiccabilis]RXZ35282.1 peptidase inhibitor I78 [Sphingomonas desiccabilis]